MKNKLFIAISVIFANVSCDNAETPEDIYESILTTVYENEYNSEDKLSSVKITETDKVYYLYRYVVANVVNREKHYKYTSNGGYSVIESSNSDCKWHTNIEGNTIEYITITNGGDTTNYSLFRYIDAENKKLEYRKSHSKPTRNRYYVEKRSEEAMSYYDENGDVTKIATLNCIDNKESFMYYISDISQIKNIETLPNSLFYLTQQIGDTLFSLRITGSEIELIEKEFFSEGKKVVQNFNGGALSSWEYFYTENGISIEASCSEDYIKTTYTSGDGNILRAVSIYDNNESIEEYEYDSNGNVTKEVDKTKRDNSDPEEDIKVIMQMYKEMLEKEQKYMLNGIKEIINEK